MSTNRLDELLAHLWRDYVAMAPRAAQLRAVFEARGERVVNDHVAFRTFGRAPIGLAALEPHLLALGYRRHAPYRFDDKHLDAFGYLPPEPGSPRVFLSELRVEELSHGAQAVIARLCGQVDPTATARAEVLCAGRLWEPVTHEEYEGLLAESEYAAWVAALGLRPNHFTISVNALEQTPSVAEVLAVVAAQGIPINEADGAVKGSPEVLLEQGSTLAERMPIAFAGGEVHEIPTCYYEFARRYPDETGELYQGFVAASASRLFESTNVGR